MSLWCYNMYKIGDKVKLNTKFNNSLGIYEWWNIWINKILTIEYVNSTSTFCNLKENGFLYNVKWLILVNDFIKEDEFKV